VCAAVLCCALLFAVLFQKAQRLCSVAILGVLPSCCSLCRPLVVEEFGLTSRHFGDEERKVGSRGPERCIDGQLARPEPFHPSRLC
jgi:hypothetical protein